MPLYLLYGGVRKTQLILFLIAESCVFILLFVELSFGTNLSWGKNLAIRHLAVWSWNWSCTDLARLVVRLIQGCCWFRDGHHYR